MIDDQADSRLRWILSHGTATSVIVIGTVAEFAQPLEEVH